MKKLVNIAIGILLFSNVDAQIETYVSKGEFGLSAGATSYQGDLNPYNKLNYLSPAVNVFFQKYFNNYISIKGSLGYAHLRYDDKNASNYTYKARNLSFGNHTAELSVSGVFHLFRYAPGYEGTNFTPYISLGVGAMYTSPYATLDGKNVNLRPLGTEGQHSTIESDGKKYLPVAATFPLAIGVKKSISERLAIFGEVGYRFTTTDYLDDVSSTYAGREAFLPENYKGSDATLALQLQDRSLNQIGTKGLQRGNSLAKDGFFTAQIGISYNLSTCNCPKVY